MPCLCVDCGCYAALAGGARVRTHHYNNDHNKENQRPYSIIKVMRFIVDNFVKKKGVTAVGRKWFEAATLRPHEGHDRLSLSLSLSLSVSCHLNGPTH